MVLTSIFPVKGTGPLGVINVYPDCSVGTDSIGNWVTGLTGWLGCFIVFVLAVVGVTIVFVAVHDVMILIGTLSGTRTRTTKAA